MISYKGGQYTIKCGGIGVMDDYVFRTLPSGKWTKVFVRVREGKLAFKQDKEALEFILQMRHHKDRLCVPDARKVLMDRPDIPAMSVYEYAYSTSPEFRQEQESKIGPYLTEFHVTPDGLETLRSILLRLRWDNQNGFQGYSGNGKWKFVSTTLPQTTSEELNILLDMAGIIPDEIESLGYCRDCAHAINGREQGYQGSCSNCNRPRMSNFEPKDDTND